ncbi:hypothetical protein [Actinoplanes sp. NPDC051494]|uniref:hypothetical protein n=1 Tax=Actinoplanes sp. NPDC051494 TaxID=3363907 RepID=UPI003788C8A3
MRIVSGAGALVATVAIGLSLASAPASAAPAAPTAVMVAGKFDGGKLTIQQAEHPDAYQRLLGEVNWLSSATPTTTQPKADKLGLKLTVTVLVKNKASQVYDVYPLAAGGPRAFRPAKQPTGKKTPGWFYGRLTMSESLRVAGVPLEQRTDIVTGGIGGGSGSDVVNEELDPLAVGKDVVAQLQQLFLLNGAVLLVVLLGLAGVAFLIRRRI